MPTSDLRGVRASIAIAKIHLDDANAALVSAIEVINAMEATSSVARPLTDPRQPNCRKHTIDASGKVTGIYLAVHAVPAAKTRLVHAELINEYDAQGQTVARCTVLDRTGRPKPATIVLAWPYNGGIEFEQRVGGIYDGGEKPYEHVITASFNPPDVGPLALYVAGADVDEIGSDVLASIGLPRSRHVSFKVVWEEE